jgi:tetratricopeptide (TPR) repeat protein
MPALVERGRECTRLADACGDPTKRVAARIFFASALLAMGQFDESAGVTRDLMKLPQSEVIAPHLVWTTRSNGIRLMIMEGRLGEAEAENDELLQIGLDAGQPDAQPWWAGTLVGFTWIRGYLGTIVDAIGEYAAQFPRSPTWSAAHVWALTEGKRLDEARAIIREHSLSASSLVVEPWPYHPPALMAFSAWLLDDPALAADAVEALAPYRDRWAHYYLVLLGPVTWPLGLALSCSGQFDEGVRALEDALSRTRDHGLSLYVPKIRLDLARVLLRRDGPGDAAAATEQLTEARREAEACGLAGVVEGIDALSPSA